MIKVVPSSSNLNGRFIANDAFYENLRSFTTQPPQQAAMDHLILRFLDPSEIEIVAESFPAAQRIAKIKIALAQQSHVGRQMIKACKITENDPGMDPMNDMQRLSECLAKAMPNLREIDVRDCVEPLVDLIFLSSESRCPHLIINSAHTVPLEELINLCGDYRSVSYDNTQVNKTLKKTFRRLQEAREINSREDLRVKMAKNIIQHADANKLKDFLNLINRDIFVIEKITNRIELYKAAALRKQELGTNDFLSFANSLKEFLTLPEIQDIIHSANPSLQLYKTPEGQIRIVNNWAVSDLG